MYDGALNRAFTSGEEFAIRSLLSPIASDLTVKSADSERTLTVHRRCEHVYTNLGSLRLRGLYYRNAEKLLRMSPLFCEYVRWAKDTREYYGSTNIVPAFL
jgi:hypothetical protein